MSLILNREICEGIEDKKWVEDKGTTLKIRREVAINAKRRQKGQKRHKKRQKRHKNAKKAKKGRKGQKTMKKGEKA